MYLDIITYEVPVMYIITLNWWLIYEKNEFFKQLLHYSRCTYTPVRRYFLWKTSLLENLFRIEAFMN